MELQHFSQSSDEEYHDTRTENMRSAISKRLRGVCEHLSDVEFEKFVDKVLECQLRGERRIVHS